MLDKQAASRIMAQDLLDQLHSSRHRLNQTDLPPLRLQYGPNALAAERITAARVLLRQFQSPLIAFLIVAAVLALATQDFSDVIIITVILLINAIRYGRGIFANINKYIKYTMVGNFGNFFALAILYLLSTDLAVLPRQVLLISLLTDLPLVAISTDAVGADELEKPNRYSARALLSISLVLGTLTALFELAFFTTLQFQSALAKQTALYLFLSLTQLVVILSIRNRGHFWTAIPPSPPLLVALLVTAGIAVAMPFVPAIATLFSFSAPSLAEMDGVVLLTLLYLMVLDLTKVFYYAVVDSPRAPPWLSQRTFAPVLR